MGLQQKQNENFAKKLERAYLFSKFFELDNNFDYLSHVREPVGLAVLHVLPCCCGDGLKTTERIEQHVSAAGMFGRLPAGGRP
jgi:hypothetical protein